MTDYENLDKFLLICKPCQSGKTSLVQIIGGGIKSTNSGTHSVTGTYYITIFHSQS